VAELPVINGHLLAKLERCASAPASYEPGTQVQVFPSEARELARYMDAARELAGELGDVEALFDLQQRRVREAVGRWQAQRPEERALTHPDLGELLGWLLARLDEVEALTRDVDGGFIDPDVDIPVGEILRALHEPTVWSRPAPIRFAEVDAAGGGRRPAMAAPRRPCPTCSGPSRETVGMVCQTCGTDYGAAEPNVLQKAGLAMAGVHGTARHAICRRARLDAWLVALKRGVARPAVGGTLGGEDCDAIVDAAVGCVFDVMREWAAELDEPEGRKA
jgi:hypothetical protein